MMTIQMIMPANFGRDFMTNVASMPAVKAGTSTETRQIVLKEIGAKWNKFSEQDPALPTRWAF